jgi:hypothetical protein
MDFEIADQQLIKFFISSTYWRKNGSIMVQYLSYLQISKKPTNELGGKYYTIFSLIL